jgi:hypothetical protein
MNNILVEPYFHQIIPGEPKETIFS